MATQTEHIYSIPTKNIHTHTSYKITIKTKKNENGKIIRKKKRKNLSKTKTPPQKRESLCSHHQLWQQVQLKFHNLLTHFILLADAVYISFYCDESNKTAHKKAFTLSQSVSQSQYFLILFFFVSLHSLRFRALDV